MFDIHAILFLWLSNLSHVLVTWSGFLALFTWSRRTTRAKDHRIFLAKLPRKQWGRQTRSHGEVQGNKCWQLAHLSYPKACYRILKYSIQNPMVKLFPLPIREFQGLCNWTTMLHVQQATSLPPNFSIKKATMDRSWFAIYLLLLKFLLHVCSLLFCICANEKTVIMTKTTT